MARSTNGCDTAASVQSKTRVAPGPKATFHGWKSPWTRVGPGPISSRRRHDSTRAGAVASHRSRRSAGIRPSSTVSSAIASTCAARSVSDRTGSPRATSSSVRPSHDCWMPACATTPSCHSDSSWSPSSAAPRSRISIHPRAASTAITSGTRSGIRSASARVATASCRKMLGAALEEDVAVRRRGAQDDRQVPELVLPRCADDRSAVRRHLLDHPGRGACEPPRARPRRPQRRPALGTLAGPRGHGRSGRLRLQPGDHLRVQVLPGPPGRRLGRGRRRTPPAA